MEFNNEEFFKKDRELEELCTRNKLEIAHRERREKIAIAAMQGILTQVNYASCASWELAIISKLCVNAADALIAELELDK